MSSKNKIATSKNVSIKEVIQNIAQRVADEHKNLPKPQLLSRVPVAELKKEEPSPAEIIVRKVVRPTITRTIVKRFPHAHLELTDYTL